MAGKKELLSENTEIVINNHPVGEYRRFFQHATGQQEIVTVCKDFQTWLFTQAGKTLVEALDELYHPTSKTIEELLQERRFGIISESDKAFLIAFDKAMSEFGYDFGGSIGSGFSAGCPLMIVYGKTSVKSRPCPARIYIRENGITLRLFLNKVDAHRQYVENAPGFIKDVFTSGNEVCTGCSFRDGKCKYRYTKSYTIDGRLIHKCDAKAFTFRNPSLAYLSDYMGLLSEFYQKKDSRL